MKKVEKGWFLCSLDTNTDSPGAFTVINFYKGESGHIYFQYENSEAKYCPINNYYIDNCKEEVSCKECPQANYFIEVNGEIIPVHRLPLFGLHSKF